MKNNVSSTQSPTKEDLPIYVKWRTFLNWLMFTTNKFPQKARFTYTDRLLNLALAVVEDLVEARYSRNKIPILDAANMKLEKFRVLIRICYEQRFLSHKEYEHASVSINEVGKMLGGWRKEKSKR